MEKLRVCAGLRIGPGWIRSYAEVIQSDTTDGYDQVDLEIAVVATNVVRLSLRLLVKPR